MPFANSGNSDPPGSSAASTVSSGVSSGFSSSSGNGLDKELPQSLNQLIALGYDEVSWLNIFFFVSLEVALPTPSGLKGVMLDIILQDMQSVLHHHNKEKSLPEPLAEFFYKIYTKLLSGSLSVDNIRHGMLKNFARIYFWLGYKYINRV